MTCRLCRPSQPQRFGLAFVEIPCLKDSESRRFMLTLKLSDLLKMDDSSYGMVISLSQVSSSKRQKDKAMFDLFWFVLFSGRRELEGGRGSVCILIQA